MANGTHSWNDRMARAAEGCPVNAGSLVIRCGDGAATVTVPSGAAVHAVWVDANGGDSTLTFPNAQVVTIKNGSTFSVDFGGLADGGDYVIGGASGHWLVSYVLAP